MSHAICSEIVASISEFKSNPMATVQGANGKPLAILNRNQPVFYCIPATLYETMVEMLDDVELVKTIQARTDEREIAVDINDL